MVDSYNNYYPFGEEMPGLNTVNAGPDDRYQYISVEQDPETSLYAMGARYYDPWAGRWMSVDPFADKYPSQSLYSYALDNPELFVDINGDSVNIRDILPEPGSVIPKPMSSDKLFTNAGELFNTSGNVSTVGGIGIGLLSLALPEGALADALGELASGLFTTGIRLQAASLATQYANYRINGVGDLTSIKMDALKLGVTEITSHFAVTALDRLAVPTEFGYRGLGGQFVSREFATEVALTRLGTESGVLSDGAIGSATAILGGTFHDTFSHYDLVPLGLVPVAQDATNIP